MFLIRFYYCILKNRVICLYTVQICVFLHYLGKRGLYTTSNGLKIAYLSGIQSKDDTPEKGFFMGSDCVAIRDACLRGQPEFRGIDILITAEWPSEVQNLDERKVYL